MGAPAQNNYYDADRLTSWDGKSFTYDQCGNTTLYKGESMTWMRGRLLKSYTKGGQKYEFDYDASGERFVKKIGDKATHYYSINGRLIREERADGTIINFLYGSDGIIGCVVDGRIYFYAKNMFGDVVAIYDYNSGNPVARYVYDAWGNHKVLTSEGSESINPKFIGHINPIRYRSYYWDDDVKLYYLHTRWYDPEIGRFVNMDQLEYLDPETVNGLNLYAYCGNNPVMFSDPDGTYFLSFLIASIAVSAAIAGICKAVSAADKGASTGQIIGSFFSGFIMGAAMGACFALGGAASVGIMGVGMALTGSLLLGAGAGLASYAIDCRTYGQSIEFGDAMKAMSLGMAQGAGTFAFGFLGGRSGALGNLAKKGSFAYAPAFAKGLVGAKPIFSVYSTIMQKFQLKYIDGFMGGITRWLAKAGTTSAPAFGIRMLLEKIWEIKF